MSFRFRKHSVRFANPQPIYDVVEHHEVENGVEVVHYVEQSTSVISDAMPLSEDYKLSSLLAAGVPLNVVPTEILSDTPTTSQIEQFSEKLSDNSNNE